jgi:hypothetical protein
MKTTAAIWLAMFSGSALSDGQQAVQSDLIGNNHVSEMVRADVIKFSKATKLDKLTITNQNLVQIVTLLNEALERAAPGSGKPIVRIDPEWHKSIPKPTSVGGPHKPEDTSISELKLHDVPLEKALEYIATQTFSGFRYEDGKISLTPTCASWGERKRCVCGSFLDKHNAH